MQLAVEVTGRFPFGGRKGDSDSDAILTANVESINDAKAFPQMPPEPAEIRNARKHV